ncbi:hypothetical protein AAG570_001096 [Ranatra chinensis]|uniref:Uncharacterized protein n=1 Tax=Ranatra chinensis TaxID=642074 RepID=A0ABD0YAW9_9HEMI
MASKRRNMFQKNKTQETTENEVNHITTFGFLFQASAQAKSLFKARFPSVLYKAPFVPKKVSEGREALKEIKESDLSTRASRRKEFERKLQDRKSTLSSENKLTLYNATLKPTWTYGVELWRSAKKSNLDRIQAFQSKALHTILDTTWYVSNRTHNGLNILTVQQFA